MNNYKSNCPSSRTVKEAQNHIKNTFGNKYTILGEKPLGVGTVAESYLAKDNNTGKEVVIKMTKKWVSPEKLQNDKQKMLDTILAFVYRTIFIHIMGVTYLGVNGLLSNIFSVMSLAELGIGSTIIYLLYEPLTKNNQKEIPKISTIKKIQRI